MRVLVTGGAGFIGSHVVDRFVADGHDVLVIDDLSSGREEQVASAARLEQVDIVDPRCREATRAFRPEVVCHHAAQMDVRRSVSDPIFDARVNVVGLLNVVEGAREGSALSHVLFASSGGAMYGEQEVYPAPEDHPVRPESPYGLTKSIGEQYLALYDRLHDVGATALRYANVYGPRQTPHGEAGVVAIFGARMLRGEPVTIFGDGGQTRDFVYVGDVVEANAAALEQRVSGSFNVGTGIETTVSELAGRMASILGIELDVEHQPERPGEQRRSSIDPRLLEAELGRKPSVTLDDGLRSTIDWLRGTL